MKLVSIVIIFDKIREELFPLSEQIRKQTANIRNFNFEVLLVHESNKKLRPLNEFSGFKYINIKEKKGFPFNRNQGLKNAKGDIIIFIDDDCMPQDKWMLNLLNPFSKPKIMAVMGNVRVPRSNYLGDCISELGFPAGANAGFDKIWKVSKDRFTRHLSTCNCAIRKEVFSIVGRFNEKLVYGAEDAELSHRISKAGLLIQYNPKALVYHKARDNLISFFKWQYRRGKANYYFREEVKQISNFMKLRLWSSWNIIKKNLLDFKIFGVILLLFLSFILQYIGYFKEKIKNEKKLF